ncbi:MAG: hypothetical protein Q8O07_09255 [Chloroflexota bacterium]|nr:hypothetical protein [Chloroflexota bacterium]
MDACTNKNTAAHQDAHAHGDEIADPDADVNPYAHSHGDPGAAHVNAAAPAASTTTADGYTD